MDTHKIDNSISYTEWVQCPYCHQVIKAPNVPGVIFLCPDCGKELISSDRVVEQEQVAMKKQEKRKDLMWRGVVGALVVAMIAVILLYKSHYEKMIEEGVRNEIYAHLAERIRNGGSLREIVTENAAQNEAGIAVDNSQVSEVHDWEKVEEWRDLSYGDGSKYILYKDRNSEEMVIDFVIYDTTIRYKCQKYTVKSDKEFLCHEPYDTPGGARGDFYLKAGTPIYVIQVGNGVQAIDDNGYYDVTGLLVTLDEHRARIFMDNYAAKGRGYFMLYAALGK